MENARKSMMEWTYEARMVKVPWIWMEVDLTSNPPREGDHIVSLWRKTGSTGEPLLTDVDLQVQYDFAGHAA